jgi:hypothetical protein
MLAADFVTAFIANMAQAAPAVRFKTVWRGYSAFAAAP